MQVVSNAISLSQEMASEEVATELDLIGAVKKKLCDDEVLKRQPSVFKEKD